MLISYDEERKLVSGLLISAGFNAEDAETVSRVITHSDFTGVYSHGLSRLTRYLRQVKAGALNVEPNFQKVLDKEAVTVFDGDNGSGIVTLNKAYEATLEKVRKYGIAISVGRHNANIGCGSYYGQRAAADNVIGLFCCNTYAFTSPFGGADRLIGTNPIVAAIPTGDEYPIVLDISTTNVAMGKIQAAEREGQKIPKEWAKDYDGNPTDDPSKAFSLSPIAGHKGYGLAVIVDALSTMLSNACAGTDIGLFTKLEKENTGFCVILIDPQFFMPLGAFHAISDRYIRMMKDSRRAPGVTEIFMPGELEYRRLEMTMASGFNVSDALGKELTELAAGMGAVSAEADFAELVKHYNQ